MTIYRSALKEAMARQKRITIDNRDDYIDLLDEVAFKG
jgi:hypothetical protein